MRNPKKILKYLSAFLILVAVGGFVISANQARAAEEPTGAKVSDPAITNSPEGPCIGFDIGCEILRIVDSGLDTLGHVLIYIPEQLFVSAVGLNMNVDFMESSARIGWTIIRDIANLFFIFILLWIALSTIFDIDKYSIKNLLPRLIIAALLINFSLVFGMFVIRVANNVAGVFNDALTLNYGGMGGVIKNISQPLNTIGDLINNPARRPKNKEGVILDSPEKVNKARQEVFDEVTAQLPLHFPLTKIKLTDRKITASQCESWFDGTFKWAIGIDAGTLNQVCSNLVSQAVQIAAKQDLPLGNSDLAIHRSLMSNVIRKIILYPVVIFVLFAGAAFLAIRFISLTFLLTLGPLAFLGAILPETQSQYNKWWENLIKWSIFFPAFVILMYISAAIIQTFNGNISEVIIGGQKMVGEVDAFMSLFLAVGFLIGSLMIAQDLGIKGAETINKYGLKAKDWAKDRAVAYGKMGVGGLSSTALSAGLGRIPLARQLFGRGAALGEKARKDEEKRRLGFAKDMTDKDRANWLANKSASDATAFMNSLDDKTRRSTLQRMSYNDQVRLMNTMRSTNSEHLVRDFTGDPRVFVRATRPEMDANETNPQFRNAVMATTDERFKGGAAKNLSPEFIRSNLGASWIAGNADKEQLQAIGSTIEGVRALGDAIVSNNEAGIPIGNYLGGSVGPNGQNNTRAADFLASTTARAIFRGRQRRGPLPNLRAAVRLEDRGQTIPKGGKFETEPTFTLSQIQAAINPPPAATPPPAQGQQGQQGATP